MASLNKVMLIGNLGKDPETTTTQGGMTICKFPLATTETRTNKDTGEKTELTEWHRITVFGNQAESCARFLAKGRQAYVEGRLQTSSYEKDGITRYSTDIIANQVTFLGSPQSQQQGGYNQQQPRPQGQGQQNQPYGGYSNGQQGGYNQQY